MLFHPIAKTFHLPKSDLKSLLILNKAMTLCKNDLPGLIALQLCCKVLIKDSKSLHITSSNSSMATYNLFSFSWGNLTSPFNVSITMPRVSFRGGRGGGHSPPLAGCLPPLEILLYIYCIVQHVALAPPWYAKTAILPPPPPPLEQNPKCCPDAY